MKKMFARNKFLWRGYFLTIIQQDVKSGCLSARSGKKDCFCFKSQKKERKIITKKRKEKWTSHHFPVNGVSTAVWAGYRQLAAARNVILD